MASSRIQNQLQNVLITYIVLHHLTPEHKAELRSPSSRWSSSPIICYLINLSPEVMLNFCLYIVLVFVCVHVCMYMHVNTSYRHSNCYSLYFYSFEITQFITAARLTSTFEPRFCHLDLPPLSLVDLHKKVHVSIMLTQSDNNPAVVIWCNAVQYIQFPIKGESVSWRLHKLMCLETRQWRRRRNNFTPHGPSC